MQTMAIKWIAAAILLALYAALATGCVTFGYDILNQRVTVAFDGKSIIEAAK